MNKIFKVKVNPFSRSAEITKGDTTLELFFNELDEWQAFNMADDTDSNHPTRYYDAHFLYEGEGEFSFDIYPVNKDYQIDHTNNLVESITISY